MLAITMLVCCTAQFAMAQQTATFTTVPPKEGDFIAQNFTFADGHVGFLSQSLSMMVFQGLASCEGGETVDTNY